jgi:membrane protease YdiL (CAAX protease family)
VRFFLKAVVIAVVGVAALFGVLSGVALYMSLTANPEAPNAIQFWAAWADLKTAWWGLVETIPKVNKRKPGARPGFMSFGAGRAVQPAVLPMSRAPAGSMRRTPSPR